MFTLVYISRESWKMRRQELFLILTQSRDYNSQHDITGLLLYHDGRFIQALEGEQDEVEKLYYKKIKKDPRHKQVETVLTRDIEKRNFPGWHMGFVSAYEEEKRNIFGFSRFLEPNYDIEQISKQTSDVWDLLLEFKTNKDMENLVDS